MIARQILKHIEHKGPNQFTFLDHPSDVELFEASQLTTHHILVETDQPPHIFMEGRGWNWTPTELFAEPLYHYTPRRLRAENWWELWGIYDYHIHTEQLIHRLPDDSTIVDIGTYHGKNAAHMAQEAKKLKKDMRICTFDPYGWTPQFKPHPKLDWMRNVKLFQDMGLNDYINSMPLASQQAVHLFEDNTVQHIHFDGATNRPEFKDEILVWLPKLYHHGSLAGTNYSNEHVKAAVDSVFEKAFIKEELDIWVSFRHHQR